MKKTQENKHDGPDRIADTQQKHYWHNQMMQYYSHLRDKWSGESFGTSNVIVTSAINQKQAVPLRE